MASAELGAGGGGGGSAYCFTGAKRHRKKDVIVCMCVCMCVAAKNVAFLQRFTARSFLGLGVKGKRFGYLDTAIEERQPGVFHNHS